jgi:hypothetical protein
MSPLERIAAKNKTILHNKITNTIATKLRGQSIHWVKASDEARNRSETVKPTLDALAKAEQLWGASYLTQRFRNLLQTRGISMYDRKIEHHFTGSAIVLDSKTRRILLTFHPWYKLWLQLGGHDEGEHDPAAVSAREAWEESGIDNLWLCDWPVCVDPHAAEKCKSAPDTKHNWHYDICYMSVTNQSAFVQSDESVDMRWFTIEEIRQLVEEGKALPRGLAMAENALILYDALKAESLLPPQLH